MALQFHGKMNTVPRRVPQVAADEDRVLVDVVAEVDDKVGILGDEVGVGV